MDQGAGLTPDPEFGARLALLRLRASVPAHWPLRDDAWAFARGEPPVSTDEAIRRLVAAPKPFRCWPEMDGDVLVVQTRVPARVEWHFRPNPDADAMFEPMYRQELGDDYERALVLCIGRDDWLVLPFGQVRALEDEYQIGGWSSGGSGTRIENEEEVEPRREPRDRTPAGALADGRARGAVWVTDYGLHGRFARPQVHVAIARIEPGPRPGPDCERCREREARYELEWLEDDRPPRRLCQRCIDEEIGVDGFDDGRDMEKLRVMLRVDVLAGTQAELTDMADELAFDWAMREPPPFIREFIARYRTP